MLKKNYLMTPGPTPVPPSVLLAQAKPIIHHRTPAYTELLVRVTEDLKYIFQTNNEVLIYACSGTGVMESSIANLFSPGDKVIVAVNGKFGQRFLKIAKAYGLEPIVLEYEWDQVVKPEEIAAVLERDGRTIKGVLVVQSETSTGVLNDVEAIGEIVKDYPALFVVDSITGIGAVECRTDDWGLDVVMTGSQKGLMMPPGLACVAVSDKAWAAVAESTLPKFYFSYETTRKALKSAEPQNPFTPPVSLMMALGEALRLMREEGLENILERHALLAQAVRDGIEAMGLELFAPPEGRGNAVTPVKVPESVDGQALPKLLESEYGITIAGGQDHLKGKIFRIGHLGYYDHFDVVVTLTGIELVLAKLGFPVKAGAGIQAAEKVFLETMSKAPSV